MPNAVSSFIRNVRSRTLTIGQMTFGSFLLLLTIITATSVGSVVAIRRIDLTFAELQRLQSVGDLAEEIERRMSDLRFAARQAVSEPAAQPAGKVFEAVSALNELLKKTRLELAPDQQEMLDGVTERLTNYRDGLRRITELMPQRAEMAAKIPSLRQAFETAVAGLADRKLAAELLATQSKVAAAVLGRDLAAAGEAVGQMRALPIGDPAAAAVRDYAEMIASTAAVERELAELDKNVLGTEGRLIGMVTELLRDAAGRRSRVLARDLGRTLAEDKWQSIVLGSTGVLVGLLAAAFVVRRTVVPLAAITTAIRSLAAGQRHTAIPATEVSNEIGDIARAAEVFRRTLVEADNAREAAVHALAEQRLAEESYRKLFEGSIDGIYVTTPEGALLNANPALARMMGYDTPAELIRATADVTSTIYVDSGKRDEYRVLMQRDGMVREFEYQARKRGGDVLWLSDSAGAIRDDDTGEVIRYEGAVRDITDQKRAEQAIAEGRRLLQQVIDTVPAVINVKDADLRYVLMNRYMAGVFGIDPKDAIGRTTTELMSRYGSHKTDANDKRVLATGEGLGFYEEEYRDATGAVRQWLVNKMPLRDAEGRIERIATVALDIGERKRGELEMRKAKDAAEAALRNLRETQQSLIEAEKLAALGRLVAGVAHEVNNPVGISLTVASALERKAAVFATEVARGELRRSRLNEFLDTTRDASSQLVANLNRAAELIQSFKQVAADRNYSDQRMFDLGDLTEQVVMSLRPGLRKHNLTLNVECQPGLTMNSFPGPYGQVLTNLFLNSVAHAFPNGRAGTVEIKVRASGKDNVEILYSDDGCGMSLDVRRRAFDPFFTTRRDQGGTGLGLHIVYSIVTNRLGGRLDLDSEPGNGTRIRIILPRVAPRDAEDPPAVSA